MRRIRSGAATFSFKQSPEAYPVRDQAVVLPIVSLEHLEHGADREVSDLEPGSTWEKPLSPDFIPPIQGNEHEV